MPNIKYIQQDREQTIDFLTESSYKILTSRPRIPKQSPTSNSIQPCSSILPNTHNTPRTSSRPFYPITRIQENDTPKTTKQCTLCPYLILSHLISSPFPLLPHPLLPPPTPYFCPIPKTSQNPLITQAQPHHPQIPNPNQTKQPQEAQQFTAGLTTQSSPPALDGAS